MAEPTLDELKQQRASTKGSISRIKNIVESNSNALTSTELECRLGILESYFKQILAYQTKIEVLLPTDTSRGEIEDLYITAKTKILSLLGTGRRSSIADMTVSTVPHTISHLPKQRLPKFSGRYSDYKNFINSYNNLVENDLSLTKIEKFNYLLSCLSDQALGTVKAFQVTEANYPKALLSLKERYDNDCLIFLEYISQLIELPKVQKASSVSLRSLVDNISALISSLLSIGSHENICNAIIIHIAMSKVDTDTQSKWDEQLDYKKLPDWKDCASILNKRCQYLEARDSKQIRLEQCVKTFNKHSSTKPTIVNPHRPQTSLAANQRSCILCRDLNHSITNCKKFLELSVMDRFWKTKKLGLCLNCLGKGHSVLRCPSSYKCKTCKQAHHSLLHRTQPADTNSGINPPSDTSGQSTSAATHSAMEKEQVPEAQVILATALVLIKDSSEGFQLGRVLLDSGSQVNFINEKFANSLGLRKHRKNVDIVGIGVTETKIKYQTQSTIRSRYSNFEISLEFLVAPSITGYQPEASLNVSSWNLPSNLELADENFNQPSQIDLLLGAEAFFDLLESGQIKLGEGLPSLQQTALGWIVSGRYKSKYNTTKKASCVANTLEVGLDKYFEKFFEFEEIQGLRSIWSEEQNECEKHFIDTIKVLPSGRLMVQLPFKKHPSCLGGSYDIAFRRFLSLERRLSKNASIKSQYSDFLKEYERLGHMSLVPNPNLDEDHYYLPHQYVLRPDSVSTKLRVVFDASCRTSSQISLNGILMVGPTIQDELLIILLRFRLYRYALTADIVKMYRQFLVHPSDRKFQFILWRENEHTPIQTYQLNTITYGTSSAPFLAIRCLQYLAEINVERFSQGAAVLKSDFYVDDMLTGADDLDTLCQKRNEVVSILSTAGLELSKWNSNHIALIEEATPKDIKLTESNLTSTLGISWNPRADEFIFSYKPNWVYTKYTKRSILSLSSSLFDPMGLLSPIIIRAKILLQQLWIEKFDWDENISPNLETEWRQFMTDLNSIQNLPIPRYVFLENNIRFQIHGFADASMKGYGCCIYLRSIDNSGSVGVKLLVAKSRVAPAKKRTLPRLELCAAHLLSKLWVTIQRVIVKHYNETYFWTDSSIVLHWISTHSSKLNTFVGNRVAEIQDTTKEVVWKHVPTSDNPADIVSRGCTAEELKSSIWFRGPDFLIEDEERWPCSLGASPPPEDLLLEHRKTVLVCQKDKNYYLNLIEKVSSYTKVLRIFAYVKRYLNLRLLRIPFPGRYLTAGELDYSLLTIVNVIQMEYFAKEIQAVKSNSKLQGSTKWLCPFIEDRNGLLLLRVGGRLKHADIPEENKHPMLLPKDCNFSKELIRHLHYSNYNAGPKALVALTRQRFWIINVRQLARSVIRRCTHCARYRPKLYDQVMGDLPAERLTSSRPFLCCGVDFCGPIYTYYKIRGKVPYKTYVAVFVCFASKAVHLEAVSDLSADAFIGALKRMIGRRGIPKDIHCDNATNFVGAQSKLSELRDMLFKKSNQENLINYCTNSNINFHFIPPRAPNFGGIWEAAVKVAKGHLYRSLGNAKLSFEELSTALVEIEAIMNSRPITSISTDPNDFEALTPAHLLIGSSLKAIPELLTEVSDISYLERWRRINAVKTHFWKRWSNEYVTELQGRGKWTTSSPNIAIGSLVIIHEDNLPPQKWLLGRVTKVIEGPDGRVRVADVKTQRGTFRRPIRKLAAIPS
ncbi:uncharacterized protein LOC129953385 [Eupeodes corollae]|uniref:uncharacterized protein LOC129953385 n=1 Tax=Eupeodes corollae TaxID=290404 RepID=UPI00249024E8|nr:uncharacterized protein LOC129953385 [Eupeodes corollae]